MKLKYKLLAGLLMYIAVGLLFVWLFAGWAIAATIAIFENNTAAALVMIWWVASWIILIVFALMLESRRKKKK